jgi:hypothetical protein
VKSQKRLTKYIQNIYQHFVTIYNVNAKRSLQLIGIMIFLIITVITYHIMIPLTQATNSTMNVITNTTNTTSDISPLANTYRIITSITAGGVIGIVTVSFLYSASQQKN